MKTCKFQFFLAVLVAALYSDIFSVTTWRRLRALLTVWADGSDVEALPCVIIARESACLSCPIFYKPLQTCGSPLIKDPELKGLGCSCYLPLKTRLRDSTCWLDDLGADSGIEYGWHERINHDGDTSGPTEEG